VGLAVKCVRKLRMWTRGEVVKKGEVLKMMNKVNKKRRKKEILRVSRHLEVMLSLVLLMREKKTQR
jgi:hypothetical protein